MQFHQLQKGEKIYHLPLVVFEIFDFEEGRTRKIQKIN